MSNEHGRITRLEEKQNDLEEKQGTIEVNMATMMADIGHIKNQVDNHLMGAIGEMTKKIDTLIPLVKDNTDWVGVWKKALVWVAVIGLGGGIITTSFFLLRTFLTK